MESRPLVSILVPIYKVSEKYLRNCIESLMNQTLKDIEIILVDDGSPDYSGGICDEYASKDNRIKVIHQKNKGLSGARNTAYYNACGEYIMFLDGDDFVDPDTCLITYETAISQNVQIVFWDIITEYSNSTQVNKTMQGESRKFGLEGCKDLQARVLNFNGKIAQVFAKLISKDFLDENNIIHIESLRQGAEGLIFNMALFENAKSAYYLDKPLNHYVYNESSISHSHNEDNYYMIVRCFEYILDYVKKSKREKELTSLLYTRLLYVIVTTGVTGYFNPSNNCRYKDKVNGYKKFLSEPLIQDSLKYGDIKSISIQRKSIIICIKLKQYWILNILGKMRKRQLLYK